MTTERPPDRPCRVILLGMMGSGKTTLGRALAERIGWTYHDNDHLVDLATGQTARELGTRGHAPLRDAEGDALRAGLQLPPPCIVGAAAGVVLDPQLRALLNERGLVVWLRADPSVLARRAESGRHRPWLDHDPVGWMTSTAAEREPLYRSVADVALDSGQSGPDALVEAIVDWLATTHCAPADVTL